MTHTFIVTVETADDGAITAPQLRNEIHSNLESLDIADRVIFVNVRQYRGRPWLLLGGYTDV